MRNRAIRRRLDRPVERQAERQIENETRRGSINLPVVVCLRCGTELGVNALIARGEGMLLMYGQCPACNQCFRVELTTSK